MAENNASRDEDDLRKMLRGTGAQAPHSVDPAVVISRARRRRLPRQLAAGAVGVLAIAGVGVLAVNVSTLTQPSSISAEQSQMQEAAPDAGASDEMFDKRSGADTLNACTAVVATPDPSRFGLELTVQFPSAAPVSAARIDGVVTMTNTSSQPVEGFTAIGPTVTVSQGDVVVALGAPEEYDATVVSLGPGESVEYAASFAPVRCDEAETGSSSEPLPPGDYELSAAADFTPNELGVDEPVTADLVTGPRSQLTLQ